MPASDEQLRQIRRYLEPGESVVWADQPRAGRSVLAAFGVWFFAVPWTLFALFWTAMAGGLTWFGGGEPGMSSVFPLFGLPFILVGLGMLSAPFWAWRRAQKTVYVVTDRRAIVGQATGAGFTLESFRPDELTDLTLAVRGDGSGTIDLRSDSRRATELSRRGVNSLGGATSGTFAHIPDVEQVFDLLRSLARTATPPLLDADPYATVYGSDAARQTPEQGRRNPSGW